MDLCGRGGLLLVLSLLRSPLLMYPLLLLQLLLQFYPVGDLVSHERNTIDSDVHGGQSIHKRWNFFSGKTIDTEETDESTKVRSPLDFRDQFTAQFVGFAVEKHVPLLLLLLHVM